MISRFELFSKRDDMSMEDFVKMMNEHAEIEKKALNLRGLVHTVINDHNQDHPLARGPVEVDGYSELVFDSLKDMEEGIASISEEEKAHRAKFCPDHKTLICAKKFDKEVPPEYKNFPLLKRMSFLSLGQDITPARFQHEWWGLHSDLVKRMPGQMAYAQNLVIDALIDGKAVKYEELPVAGVVEFWYKDQTDFKACFAGPDFVHTRTHGAEFLGGVTTNMGYEVIYDI